MTSHTTILMSRSLLALALVISAACESRNAKQNGAGQTTAAARSAPPDTAKGATGMSGMPGMSGGTGTMNGGLMDSMRAEMTGMHGMTPEQLKVAMPAHRQMTANMLAQLNADMRSMNMTGDLAWNALVDSVRHDLVQMPDLPAAQLPTFFRSHTARVNRLMAMHQTMMKR